MRASRLNLPDLISAAALIVVGGLVIWEASGYPFGTARAMGPGFFPILLGACLVGLAGLVAFGSLKSATPAPVWPARAGLAITSAVLAFALLIERGGLLPAVFALVILASLAERPFRPIAAFLTALGVAVIAVSLFIVTLNMRMAVVSF